MTNLRMIEIDFDVHKRIEQERSSFAESPNDVLRRMLGITSNRLSSHPASSSNRAWWSKGVMLPHGTELCMNRNGHQYTGKIDNGVWVVEGQRFKSPSGAARGVALTKNGKQTQLDGWALWKVKRPEDKQWIGIESLRK